MATVAVSRGVASLPSTPPSSTRLPPAPVGPHQHHLSPQSCLFLDVTPRAASHTRSRAFKVLPRLFGAEECSTVGTGPGVLTRHLGGATRSVPGLNGYKHAVLVTGKPGRTPSSSVRRLSRRQGTGLWGRPCGAWGRLSHGSFRRVSSFILRSLANLHPDLFFYYY